MHIIVACSQRKPHHFEMLYALSPSEFIMRSHSTFKTISYYLVSLLYIAYSFIELLLNTAENVAAAVKFNRYERVWAFVPHTYTHTHIHRHTHTHRIMALNAHAGIRVHIIQRKRRNIQCTRSRVSVGVWVCVCITNLSNSKLGCMYTHTIHKCVHIA